MKVETVLDAIDKLIVRTTLARPAGGRELPTEKERAAYLAALDDVRQAIVYAAIPRPVRNRLEREQAEESAKS